MQITPFFDKLPVLFTLQFVAADGVAPKGYGFSLLNAYRLYAFWTSNSDAIPHTVELILAQSGGPTVVLGQAVVPAGAGYAGSPPIELLTAIFGANPDPLFFDGNSGPSARVTVAMVAAAHLDCYILGAVVQ